MRRFLPIFIFVWCGAAVVAATDDPVGSLIDSEKEKTQAWLDEPRDVPAVFLWGDENGVEIDNPRVIDNAAALCSNIEYDQWLALSDTTTSTDVVTLNVASPRMRELLSETCLVRPTDHVLAVGKGWQKEVSMNSFVLRRSQAPCADQFPVALWGAIENGLPEPPLFFTTHLDFGERDNSFAPSTWTVLKNGEGDARFLETAVPHLSEYVVSISSLSASNVDALYFLERRTVTPEDDALPHEILAWCKASQCQTLWLERVNQKKGSGHLNVIGTLDFNGDGRRDLLLEGDNAGCPYKKIFMGIETGFSPMETPDLSCSC